MAKTEQVLFMKHRGKQLTPILLLRGLKPLDQGSWLGHKLGPGRGAGTSEALTPAKTSEVCGCWDLDLQLGNSL